MNYGTSGKILRVDLTNRTTGVETFDEEFYRLYPGGKALAAYILLKELPPHTEPLDPGNILVCANGLLTGAPFSTATRYTVIARSPLTRAFGESEAAGYWGPELKMAGWEAIVVKGRASSPVYLWIHNDQVEIRDARHLWGREPLEAQEKIRADHGDKLIRVLQIGIGGENLVRYAGMTNDLRHFNARNGIGAVMGSKNLKAIAVRGTRRWVNWAHDPKPVAELGQTLAKRVKEHPQSWDLQDKGTPGLVDGLNAGGILPTRNFHQGAFEGVDKVKWQAYEKELLTARKSCYACAVRCKREVKVDDRYQVSDQYGGPEYESLDAFGPNCAVDDLQAIAKANELCNRYTLDTISCGATIAFAMECFEHGLLTTQDTGGIALRFGNAAAMLQMVDLIARREGIGDLLAEGVKRAAEKIGGDAKYFAMHVKGQELPMHDPRGKVGVGLGYAINECGADHLTAPHDGAVANPESVSFKGAQPLGIEAVPPRELSPRKVRNYYILENWTSAEKVTGMCFFGVAPRSFIQVDELVNVMRAATGWDWTAQDVMRIGERATNMARAFNVREGFTAQEDTLPERLFQPLENGALQGVGISQPDFAQAIVELYEQKGWNAQGIPTREKLRDLGIEWVADLLPV
ncbi:MAG: aldehyde ferredoxin oxidoreductase family protein [Chloroflexi bacterium]|nr:aldehyde ferredoxin oxidoreductase family protein [Chloroflexota bacterium]